MQQQSSSSQPDPSDEATSVPQQESPQRDAEGTWGLGSASALDSLRKQNYRGKRSQPGEDRPNSR